MSEQQAINSEAAPEIQSETPSEPSVETQSAETQPAVQVETTEQIQEVSQEVGIQPKAEGEISEPKEASIHDLVKEVMSGEVSEETQKLIEDNNLGQYLDAIVGHQKMQIEKNDQEIISVVGSQESYSELQEWASNSLSPEEQEAYNEALFSGNLNLAKLAVQGLKAKYESTVGKAPDRVIEAGGSANEDNRPYSGVAEYIKATQSFEYKQDPEYRAKVDARRNLSGF